MHLTNLGKGVALQNIRFNPLPTMKGDSITNIHKDSKWK